MTMKHAVPGKDGNKYVPYEERTGSTSVVYFTRDLTGDGLLKIYHFGKSTTPDRLDQTWVNCLNLFDAGYTV